MEEEDREGVIAAAALGDEAVQAGVAPAIAAEALSRRRVLQTLKLIPVPELLPADDELGGGAAREVTAANTAANVTANASYASYAAAGAANAPSNPIVRPRVHPREDAGARSPLRIRPQTTDQTSIPEPAGLAQRRWTGGRRGTRGTIRTGSETPGTRITSMEKGPAAAMTNPLRPQGRTAAMRGGRGATGGSGKFASERCASISARRRPHLPAHRIRPSPRPHRRTP